MIRDLLWQPAGCLVRFVAVIHPQRGRCILMRRIHLRAHRDHQEGAKAGDFAVHAIADSVNLCF